MTYRPRPLLALPLQILALAGPNSGCDQYRTATLVRSVPVALARPTETGTMEWAIEVSLAKRHWTVLEHSGNSYRARLSERDHQVEVKITYDTRGFAIGYLDSVNLLYERDAQGRETIHRKYLTWVRNLQDDISARIAGAMRPGAPRHPAAPPPEGDEAERPGDASDAPPGGAAH
jgi:hypothetical protein